ncbi:MAG: hypothetical protein Q9227_003351 [Pyrenula ochraceoflavens]
MACLDDGIPLGENAEIILSPDIVHGGGSRIERCADNLGLTLISRDGLSWDLWGDFVSELVFGLPCPTDRNTKFSSGQNPLSQRCILGAPANGMTAVSDLVVNTTVETAAWVRFYIQKGQILNIQASSHLETVMDLTLDPEPEITSLHACEPISSGGASCIDVEPCWERDPRTIIFRAREMGNLIASLNMRMVLDRLEYKNISCYCPKAFDAIDVPLKERWQHVSFASASTKQVQRRVSQKSSFDGIEDKILIDASKTEVLQYLL